MTLDLNPDVYRTVLECMPRGLYLVDRQRRIVFWNTAAENITGYLGQEVVGHFCHDNVLMHCDQDNNMLCVAGCPLLQSMQDGRSREACVFLRHKDGQRVPVEVCASPLRDEFGTIIGAAEFFEQRSSENRFHSRNRSSDTHDFVTQLPDYPVMVSTLQEATEEFAVSRRAFGVLCIALEQTDQLCHTGGRQAVNAALYAVSQTLAANIRPFDLVGRGRNDRFLALIACSTGAALTSCAERLKRLISVVGFPWWGDRLAISVSTGGTLVRVGDTVDSLLGRAEEALEAGMSRSRDSVSIV